MEKRNEYALLRNFMTTCKNGDHLVLCFKQINNFMFKAFSTPSSKPRPRKYKKKKILKHYDDLLGKYAECASMYG